MASSNGSIAILLLLPTVAQHLANPSKSSLANVFLTILILIGLSRGWSWARTWIEAGLILGSIASCIGVWFAEGLVNKLLALATAIAWAMAARFLISQTPQPR